MDIRFTQSSVFIYHTQLILHLGLLAPLCEIIGSLVGFGGSLYAVDTIGGGVCLEL